VRHDSLTAHQELATLLPAPQKRIAVCCSVSQCVAVCCDPFTVHQELATWPPAPQVAMISVSRHVIHIRSPFLLVGRAQYDRALSWPLIGFYHRTEVACVMTVQRDHRQHLAVALLWRKKSWSTNTQARPSFWWSSK